MNIAVRKISADEVGCLQSISVRTFEETFAEDNSAEDMAQYLQEKLSIEKLSQELANPQSEFYLAESQSDVIGYLKLNIGAAQTESQPGNSVEIERIYVAKEYLGMKVGRLLLAKALERAADTHADYIWLGVWEHNDRAISFYKKNGFEVFGQHQFALGTDIQTDLMMRKILSR